MLRDIFKKITPTKKEAIQTHVAGLSVMDKHLANSNKTVVLREYTNNKYTVSIAKDNALDYTEDFIDKKQAIEKFEKIQMALFRRIIKKIEG